MKALTTGTILVVLILGGVDPVHATSCPSPGPPQQNVQDSDAVFSGEVITIEELPTSKAEYDLWIADEKQKVTFKVGTAYKGVDTPTVTLEVPIYSGYSETFPFTQGQHYLVYANYRTDDQSGRVILTTDECKGNKLLAAPLQPATEGTGNILLLLAVGSLLVISMSVMFFLRQRQVWR